MIKLVALDLDGSLLTDDKQFPPDFEEIIGSLLNKGLTVVVASGRPYHNLSDLFKKWKEQLYFASDNGTYLRHGQNELLIDELRKPELKKFVEIARSINQVFPVLCGKDKAFIENTDSQFISYAMRYYQVYEVVNDLSAVDDLIMKISMCDLIDSETNSYPHYQKYKNNFTVAMAGRMWLDITSKDGTKGNAIKKIQTLTGITPEETLAFGDYMNDFDMLGNARYSYAMKNAHPMLKSAARYVTKLDNNHFGVTETLKELFSI